MGTGGSMDSSKPKVPRKRAPAKAKVVKPGKATPKGRQSNSATTDASPKPVRRVTKLSKKTPSTSSIRDRDPTYQGPSTSSIQDPTPVPKRRTVTAVKRPKAKVVSQSPFVPAASPNANTHAQPLTAKPAKPAKPTAKRKADRVEAASPGSRTPAAKVARLSSPTQPQKTGPSPNTARLQRKQVKPNAGDSVHINFQCTDADGIPGETEDAWFEGKPSVVGITVYFINLS